MPMIDHEVRTTKANEGGEGGERLSYARAVRITLGLAPKGPSLPGENGILGCSRVLCHLILGAIGREDYAK